MATTRIIPMHKNKGKTVSACLKDRLDYIKNPDKTENERYVSSYMCNSQIADAEFMVSKTMYEQNTGRKNANDVIAYQVRQAFKHGEITPEKANEIGYELATKITKGNHAFVVATHTDKKHIHNHIIWNSTNLTCDRKFRNMLNSAKIIRTISDILCLKNNLSIVENPKAKSVDYDKWLGDKKQKTHTEILKEKIDEVLKEKPKSFEEFISNMRERKYEVKVGKYISFKSPDQKKFIRSSKIGEDYSREVIEAIISGKVKHEPRPSKNNLLIDIEQKVLEGKGKGYENWAKKFNLKQMAKTINYLSENNLLNTEELNEKVEKVTEDFSKVTKKIRSIETELKDINELKNQVITYLKTIDKYKEYINSGYSKKLAEKYHTEITLNRASKKYFDSKGIKKLPKVKDLQSKYIELNSQKRKLYDEYYKLKDEKKELLIAQINVREIMKDKSTQVGKKRTQEFR